MTGNHYQNIFISDTPFIMKCWRKITTRKKDESKMQWQRNQGESTGHDTMHINNRG